MKASQTVTRVSVVLAAALVAACGGGGGGGASTSSATAVTTLSGTAAVGHPIVGGSVSVRCAGGTPPAATITDSNGAWSIDVANQTLPCAVALTGGTANGVANTNQYHSVTTARGVVNITPMTDLLVANIVQSTTPSTWFASLAGTPTALNSISQANIDASLQRFRNAYPLLSALSTINPISDSFTPSSGNSMDDMLEALAQTRAQIGSTHADDLAVVAVSGAIQPSAAFYSALVWKYRGTSTGGGSNYASTLVTGTAPASTYTGGSEELAAYNLLNSERNSCGFGYLAQSTLIDAAAVAHAEWRMINWVSSHYENQGSYPTGYTGYNGGDRITYQGYSNIGGWADDMSGVVGTSTKTGRGIASIRALLGAPFHAKTVLDGYRDFGVGIRSNVDTGTSNAGVFEQVNLAYKTTNGKQQQASSEVLTYPCQGTSGVNYRLAGETPNPVPGRDLATNPLGHPIYIRARSGNALSITSVTMTAVVAGTSVTLRSASQTKSDDTGGLYSSHEAYVIPDAPLATNTTYRVVISGTNAQVPFTKDFQFTTGSGG